MTVLTQSFQDPALVVRLASNAAPVPVTQFRLNGALGRSKLHTVVPLEIFSSTPILDSSLYIAIGDKPLLTQRRIITRDGGRPSAVELVAVGDVPAGMEFAQVVGITQDMLGTPAPQEGWHHPDLANPVSEPMALVIEANNTGSGNSVEVFRTDFTAATWDDDEVYTQGPVYREYEFNEMLAGMPTRTWIRVYRHLPLIEFDFDIENASYIQPVGDVVFERLYLELGTGMRAVNYLPVRSAYNVPGDQGVATDDDLYIEDAWGDDIYVFADADVDLPEGGKHCILMHREYHARLAIVPSHLIGLGEAVVGLSGWGVCDNGGRGYDYFSINTPTYHPHNTPLPQLLPHRDGLRQKFEKRWASYSAALMNGTPIVSELGGEGVGELGGGFYRRWGPAYGGVTGGVGLGLRSGVEEAACGSAAGVRQLMLEHWCDGTTRALTGLCDDSGQPIFVPDIPGNGRFVYSPGFETWGKPRAPHFTHDFDPGFNQYRTQERVDWLQAQCPYAKELMARGSQDTQHGGRYMQDPMALAMLLGDRIAIRHMELRANGSWVEARLRYDMAEAAANEGLGTPNCGRSDAWGLRMCAEAFRLEDAFNGEIGTKIAMADWMAQAVEFFHRCQMPTGLTMRNHFTKYARELAKPGTPSTEQPGITSTWQNGMVADSVYAVAQSVFRHLGDKADVMRKCYEFAADTAAGILWGWQGNGNAWDHFAVAEKPGAPLYTDFDAIPEGFKRGSMNYYLPPVMVSCMMSAAVQLRDSERTQRVVELLEAYLNGRSLAYASSMGFQDERDMKAPLIWLSENFDIDGLKAIAAKI